MKKYAVAGSPIVHSKSPELYNYFAGYKNKDSVYTKICTNSAEDLLTVIKKLDFSGINITSPLKETIIPLLDDISDEAKKIKSVNTVINNDGKFIGHNTDHRGVIRSFETSGVQIKNKKCLVLGAGGAARSAVYGLLNAGGNVIVCNRTLKKAEMIAKDFNCKYIDINDINKEIQQTDIITSTIPNDSEILKDINFGTNHILFTADYRNEFALDNKLDKPRIISGLLWLIFQGAASFKLFTGKDPEKIDLKKLKLLLKRDHIKNKSSLIGFSGSGKTTIAKEFDTINSVDIDEEIEKKVKTSISDIFKTKGEQFFRNIERPVLRKYILDPKAKLIACGGGSISNKKSRELLTKHTNIVWIWTPLDIIRSRVQNYSRPLLETTESLEDLFLEREKEYFKINDMIIPNTDNDNGIGNIITLLKNENLF